MKNLSLQSVRAAEVPTSSCSWFSVGAETLFVYADKKIHKFCLVSEKVLGCFELDVPSEDAQVVGFNFVSLWNKLYVAFSVGEVATLEGNEVNFIGAIESGIKAMEWSVDESLVVLVSGEDKVMVLSADFDPVSEEVDLHQDSFGDKQFVNVGWGKKETQFHGSVGKSAAQIKAQTDDVPAGELDDSKPRISWRGDGAFFAVSYIKKNSGARQIRVFNKEGVLQYTSEPTPGLEQSLSWKLSGSVIASTIRLPNKHIVGFFEKNGLRHGDFSLPVNDPLVQVKELSWNLDSTILAVWCFHTTSKTSCLQLWAASNYNWQLKQTLDFPQGQNLIGFSWDKELIYNLHVVQEGIRYVEYVWRWGVDHSSGFDESDLASVAVIDGAQVKMTNLKEAVVPPPMCSYFLKLPHPASSVAFAAIKGCSNDLYVITSENQVACFKQQEPSKVPDLISTFNPDEGLGFDSTGIMLFPHGMVPLDWGALDVPKFSSVPGALHHWTHVRENVLVCVLPGLKTTSLLLKVVLEEDDAASIKSAKEVPGVVRGLCVNTNGQSVIVNVSNDCLKLFNLDDDSVTDFSTSKFIQFPNFSKCNQFEVFEVDDELHVMGRNLMGILYLNNVDVMKNCSSYFIQSHFILITTSENKLLCIPRTKNGIETLMNRAKVGADGTERQIENGAVLVSAVSCGTRVVLQMPRGNLEAVQPRALAIHIIKHLLDNLKYLEAFDIMRKQRINLNLIYDHDPKRFVDNIKEFVMQIKNPTWLCLFLTDLMETDVTHTMYGGHYPSRQAVPPNVENKLEFICRQMRESLESVDKEGLLLPIISTYVKISKIGDALQCINTVKVQEQRGSKLAVSSDDALNYLFYIVDVYELFDVALGLYDFELVMLVAQKSQKDPKEYIPMLNELRKLEPTYQKFTIDKHLKKYESALKHLKDCGPEHHKECMKFVADHNLYSAALKIFPSTHPLYQDLCKEYGASLMAGQCYEEAGIIFQRAQSFQEAVDAFKKAGCWRRIIPLVSRLGWSAEKIASYYEEIGHELREKRRYLDSALVFSDLVNKPEERFLSLCKAKAWDEALRVQSMFDIPGSDQMLRFEVVNQHGNMLVDIETAQEQVTQYTARLQIVRAEKAKKYEEGADDLNNLPECDMYSDTSSIRGSTQSRSSGMSSRGSGRTYRSSKNKRKHERKLLSLKEGSQYEDLALVRALYELFAKIYSYRDEVKSLCAALLLYGLDGEASALQSNLSALLKDAEDKKASIWIPELAQNRAAALSALGPDGTSNSLSALNQINPMALTAAAELDAHLCLPPVMPHSNWKLKILS